MCAAASRTRASSTPNDGNYRCPNSQQGYSPFSTWTRGLAWAMCGFAEQLEFFEAFATRLSPANSGRDMRYHDAESRGSHLRFLYREHAAGRNSLLGHGRSRIWRNLAIGGQSRPIRSTHHEPVDSSAAAIAAQGLLRLGRYLKNDRYRQAGLTVANTLFDEPYLSTDPKHQGMLLHAVYHRPNGWDSIPAGPEGSLPASHACGATITRSNLAFICCGSIENKPYLTFWSESR